MKTKRIVKTIIVIVVFALTLSMLICETNEIYKEKNNVEYQQNEVMWNRRLFEQKGQKYDSAPAETAVSNVSYLQKVMGFKAYARTSNSISLTWNKVNGAQGYVLYKYDTASKKWNRLSKTIYNSYRVSNLSPATRCYFTIRAYKLVNTREVLSADMPIIAVNTLLPKTTGLKATSYCNKVKLSWNPVEAADGYVIYKCNTVNKKWERVKKIATTNCNYTVSGLRVNTKYCFTVRAYKTIGGIETLSDGFVIISATTLKSTISGIKTSFSETMVRLSWNDSSNESKYNIYQYNPTTKKWVLKNPKPIKNKSYLINNLQAGKKYIFGIKVFSKRNSFVTVSGTTLPGIVRFAADKNGNSLYLHWAKRSEADEYIIYTMLPGQSWKAVAVTRRTSYTLNNMNYDKYYVTVRACVRYTNKRIGGDFIKTPIQKKAYTKTMYCDGDSIAFGAGSHGYSYATIYAENHNMKLTNKAISGSTLSMNNNGRNHIADSVVKNVNGTYDYIVLDGGVNDYYTSSPLGKVTANGNTKFNTNTTCGGLEYILSYVTSKCKTSKIYFVSSHNIKASAKPNLLGLTGKDYDVAIKKVCKKYGVTVINCYGDALNAAYTTKKNPSAPNGDGIHPTEAGYRKYYMPLLEKVIK